MPKRYKRKKFRKRMFSVTLLLFFFISMYFGFEGISSSLLDDSAEAKKEQGVISIINVDAETGDPIKNTEYIIIDLVSNEAVEVLKTGNEGIATSKLLDYGTSYKILQSSIMFPYKLDVQEFFVEISDQVSQITSHNNILEYVKEFRRMDNGEIEVVDLYIPVETLMQKPELPNGCEITSLTAVLNYYGYNISKTEMADFYLPKQSFNRIGNKLYGANPYKAYAGDPRDARSGFFAYAPPVVEAAEIYFNETGGTHKPIDISGSTREEIIDHLNRGIPVVIWRTLELDKSKVNYSWYFHDTHEYFPAPVNLHSTVLNGYVGDKVHVMDPLKGQVKSDANKFFASYYDLGSHAMVVVTN